MRKRSHDTIEHKVFPFTQKADGERTITGYANVYGIKDEVGDIVEPGTFTRSLSMDNVRPLLWQHDSDEFIGDGIFADTPEGLALEDGKLFEGVQRADEAYAIAKQTRTKMGLSIGFSIPAGGSNVDEKGVRHITEAKLFEVSLVTFPANTASRVESVKGLFADALAEEEAERDLWEQRWKIDDALRSVMDDLEDDDTVTPDEKVSAFADAMGEYAAAMVEWFTDKIASESSESSTATALAHFASQMDAETKAGRVLSQANLDALDGAIAALQAIRTAAEDPGKAAPLDGAPADEPRIELSDIERMMQDAYLTLATVR